MFQIKLKYLRILYCPNSGFITTLYCFLELPCFAYYLEALGHAEQIFLMLQTEESKYDMRDMCIRQKG